MKKYSTNDFIEKAQNIHKYLYDYSNVRYINIKTKVEIICKTHGSFWQIPHDHLKGNGCPKCIKNRKLTTEQFIEKAKQIHKGRYDYSITEYVNSQKSVKIVCKEHGVFEQKPSYHLQGCGCPKCSSIIKSEKMSLGIKVFIEKAQQTHKGKYDYSLTEYVNTKTPIKIICSSHGIFEQTPEKHLQGHGCPKCNHSKGELSISTWLQQHNIVYESQKKFPELGNLSYDFYISQLNLLIEYNGIQHYQFIKFFHSSLHDFHYQKHRDWLKRKFAQVQGIILVVIPYWNFDIIEKVLEEYMKEADL